MIEEKEYGIDQAADRGSTDADRWTASAVSDGRTGHENCLRRSIVQRDRLFSLDLLRGFAALLVLIRHLPPTKLVGGNNAFESFLQWVHSIGWVGVDLFFVLSGVLISTLIYREFDQTGDFAARRFFLRRGFKIWPSYFAAYGVAFILRVIAKHHRGNAASAEQLTEDALWNALFLQNYVDCERWSHSWSIAIEEHFYIGLAILVTAMVAWNRSFGGKRVFAFLPWMWLCVALAAFSARWAAATPRPNWHAVYYPTHMRFDALMFGVLIGYFSWYRPSFIKMARENAVFPLLGLGLAFGVPAIWPLHDSWFLQTFGFILIYMGFGLVVCYATGRPQFGANSPQPLRIPCQWLASLGVYSYTIYLAHAVIFMIPGAELIRQSMLTVFEYRLGSVTALWLDRISFWSLSILLGVTLSHVVERPFLKLRSRLYSEPLAVLKPQCEGTP